MRLPLDGSYLSRSFFVVWKYRIFLGIVLLVVAQLLVPILTTAQQAVPSQTDGIAIHGIVLDMEGKPVDNASVRLEHEGGPNTSTTTNSDGFFTFPKLPAGMYQIRAEKFSLHSHVVTISASKQVNRSDIQLVLESPDAVHSSQGHTSTDGMAFADQPSFTVAGITDWTAVGGHGSDSSLRTSEALARETASLKPENSRVEPAAPAGETESRLRAALAANPGKFEPNHKLGEFCFRKGSYREAIPPLETAYKIDPTNRDNEYDLALAYRESGDFLQAREHIQKLLAREENADLHRTLGDVDEAIGDSVAAEHEYEQAVRMDPSEQNYFAWGSELLLHRAIWPAVEVFRKGSEAHPESARMLAALGAALFASAQYEEAAQRLCDASDLNPADTAPYIFLGKIDMTVPAPLPCAEPKLKKFVEEQPQDARASYYYAMAIWKRHKESANSEDEQRIASLLSNAVAIDPKYGEAYLQLGNFYADEHNSDKAVNFYAKAIDVNPQLSEAHYRLGVMYERAGESAKAKHEFDLHDEIEKAQAAAVERQRQEVKQFLVVLQSKPVLH